MHAGRDGLPRFQWVEELPKSLFYQKQWRPISCSDTANAESLGRQRLPVVSWPWVELGTGAVDVSSELLWFFRCASTVLALAVFSYSVCRLSLFRLSLVCPLIWLDIWNAANDQWCRQTIWNVQGRLQCWYFASSFLQLSRRLLLFRSFSFFTSALVRRDAAKTHYCLRRSRIDGRLQDSFSLIWEKLPRLHLMRSGDTIEYGSFILGLFLFRF